MAEPPVIPTVPANGAAQSGGQAQKSTAPVGSEGETKSSVKRLDGITSIDDKVFLECEILAYAAVGEIAVKVATESKNAVAEGTNAAPLAEEVKHKDTFTPQVPDTLLVVLLDEELMSAFRLFASLQLQLALFEEGFAGVAPAHEPHELLVEQVTAGPGLTIGAVSGAVEGVVDLLGLFRQDTQFFGRAVSIRETALYIELAHAFRKEGFNVLYPRLLSYQASLDTQPSQVTLKRLFGGVSAARQRAAQRLRPLLQHVAELEQQVLDRRREFPDADPDRQKALTNELQDLQALLVDARKNLDPDLVLFENTDAQWNELQKGLVRADDKSGQVPMQLLVRAADVLAVFLNSPDAYFCYANAVVAGGTMRIRRNLLRTLFCGDALEFSGGAIVSYALLDGNARILTARTHRQMTEFRGFSAKAPLWTSFNT